MAQNIMKLRLVKDPVAYGPYFPHTVGAEAARG